MPGVSVFHVLVLLVTHFANLCYTGPCYTSTGEPITCITYPVDAAFHRTIKATNTCGTPPERYCYIGPERNCSTCDASDPDLSHPASNMVDIYDMNTNITWWQSQSWWMTNLLGHSKMYEPLQVIVTLSMGKSYLISGGIYVTFYSERPKQLVIERSRDFGKTWMAYQYYAKNCRSAYNMQADPVITAAEQFKQICSEKFSGEFPRSGGSVFFDPRPRYTPDQYYHQAVREYLEATDIRLRLEYPGTDGREYINQESTLSQYYFAISSLKVDARCNCNGHAEYCEMQTGYEFCECKHFTTGVDCEQCLPLYRNRPWKAGTLTDANPCQKCECNNHSDSCIYSDALQKGVCQSCQHNTAGANCELCTERYFRDETKALSDPDACTACNCYAPGIIDNGLCSQSSTASRQIGQCNCKPGIYGRRCNECMPGKWGFKPQPIGSCFDCDCNIFGTLSGTQLCEQSTGQCPCKPSVAGRACDQCADGYYMFPTTVAGSCQPCPCDAGGSLASCDKLSGACACKPGVTGISCKLIQSGFFFPNFTYVTFEPELFTAGSSTYFLARNYGKHFTGLGYAYLDVGVSLSFPFMVATSANYFLVLRYSLYHREWYSTVLPRGRELVDWSGFGDIQAYTDGSDLPAKWIFTIQIKGSSGQLLMTMSFSMAQLQLGHDRQWASTVSLRLEKGKSYVFSMIYDSVSNTFGTPWPLLVDAVVLALDYTQTSYYTSLDFPSKRNVMSCYSSSLPLGTTRNLPVECAAPTFTIDLEVYGSALLCDCYHIGSLVWNECAAYGGQCLCKNGYDGRRCDQCLPNFFGNPGVGCQDCQCSAAGSITFVCNRTTGECACKKNAHGLRCHECRLGFFDHSILNPDGCQACFGFGHASSCKSAAGFVRSEVSTYFGDAYEFDGWKLLNQYGEDITESLVLSASGIRYTYQPYYSAYLSAPVRFLGRQLWSFGQQLLVKMTLAAVSQLLAKSEWHVRLLGNSDTIVFKYEQPWSAGSATYTIRLHHDYLLNGTKLSEFRFKALLGQLTGLHLAMPPFPYNGAVTLESVRLMTASYNPRPSASSSVSFVEEATCITGYAGLSCERCAEGYTRLISNGGPLVSCVPCNCNNRSDSCDPESGVCINCRPGTTGSYCEKCVLNVKEPSCDQCELGYWGLNPLQRECAPCDCFLPGTLNGNTLFCDQMNGQCICNNTMNVGGRQCNRCKENSYNISLGNDLMCQECPLCYNLIEETVLLLRYKYSMLKIELEKLLLNPEMSMATPLFQSLATLSFSVSNMTKHAEAGKQKSGLLDFMWRDLQSRGDVFIETIASSTTKKMQQFAQVLNSVLGLHNVTLLEYSTIFRHLIESFLQLNNTVNVRLAQQQTALIQLQNLANEMVTYTSSVLSSVNGVVREKTQLLRNIQVSIDTARSAVDLAGQYESSLRVLIAAGAPVHNRSLYLSANGSRYWQFSSEWLRNASRALTFARSVLESIDLLLPDNLQTINSLQQNTNSLNQEMNTFSSRLTSLSNLMNAVAVQISLLKQEGDILFSQVLTASRRSTYYLETSAQDLLTAQRAFQVSVKVNNDAVFMLSIVQNFQFASSDAAAAASKALLMVDSVLSSVTTALTSARRVRELIRSPKTTAEQAVLLMRQASALTKADLSVASSLYDEALLAWSNAGDALSLVQDDVIKFFVSTEVTPKIFQCRNFSEKSTAALNSARSALKDARDAFSSATSAALKITVFVKNIEQLGTVAVGNLNDVVASLASTRSVYRQTGLASSLLRLRSEAAVQAHKMSQYRYRNSEVKKQLEAYKLMLLSLPAKACS